jgi:hypothetical protein
VAVNGVDAGRHGWSGGGRRRIPAADEGFAPLGMPPALQGQRGLPPVDDSIMGALVSLSTSIEEARQECACRASLICSSDDCRLPASSSTVA